MFKRRFSLVVFVLLFMAFAQTACTNQSFELQSPDGSVAVKCWLNDNGEVLYQVDKDKSVVITPSLLGLEMADENFVSAMKISAISAKTSINESYEMLHGKQQNITYAANQQSIAFLNSNNNKMEIIFRVSDDGVAFRYYFPDESEDIKQITAENTAFTFDALAKGWLQPMAIAKSGWCETNPSYEENYLHEIPVGTLSPLGQGWVFPALFKTNETWVLITESDLGRNYCGSRLMNETPEGEYRIGFPQNAELWPGKELLPESKLPWYTPWRIIVVGSLATIVESNLETSLATPAIEGDFTWVKPGKASWSWVLLKDDNTIYPVQKAFIDHASDMNWEYCLIDCDWDWRIGYDKIAELVEYANQKNVGIILWYNSSGPWNSTTYTPKSKLLTADDRAAEFKRIADMGVKGVKVDFFGGDGQSMIAYYHDLMQDAAQAGLTINFHGCTYPRSWHRTYPNLVTMESVKGMEFVTFVQDNADVAPQHGATLCFTRNVFSPMDFTPMALHSIPNIKRLTTNAYELATSVLFLSGIQHYAETPEGMKTVPADVKDLLRNIPSVFDESKFVDGFPGKSTIIARRKGQTWYVAGINGENIDKELRLELPFIDNHDGLLINEGEDAFSFKSEYIQLLEHKKFDIKMKPNGGFLMVF